MRVVLAAIIVAVSAVSAFADDLSVKDCIMQTAERLPQIQGLSITGVRAEAAPPKGERVDIFVEITIKAATVAATYSGSCTMIGKGRPKLDLFYLTN